MLVTVDRWKVGRLVVVVPVVALLVCDVVVGVFFFVGFAGDFQTIVTTTPIPSTTTSPPSITSFRFCANQDTLVSAGKIGND